VTFDDAADERYGADFDAFVKERARLAKKLREEGDKAGAARVAKLPKPTRAAWALNQLARRERRDVDLLLDAGHRLRQAQAGVLKGEDRETFERVQKTERDALKRLTDAARRTLGGSSSSGVAAQITGALRAAAVSDEGRELLARGRFTTPPEPAGFDVLDGMAPPSGKKAKAKAPPAAGRSTTAKEALREAKARVRELAKEAQAAEKRVSERARDLEAARRDAAAIRKALAAAERAAEQAERRARA
jgi:hypothetical protein